MTTRLDQKPSLAAAARAFQGGGWDRAAIRALLADAGASQAGERLAQESCVAVVTGQQPALGGGPLYTLAKVAHAVALARDLAQEGQPAQAVFWCASEDHDLGEANHADLVGDDGALTRVANNLGGGRASLSHRAASHGWEALTRALARRWPSAVGAEFLHAHAPRADEGLGAWLCRLLGAAFGPEVACIEAWRLRPLWGAAMQAALTRWPAEALARRRAELLQDGWHDAFGSLAEPPVFDDDAAGRKRLGVPEARALAAADPGRLSPGAALRPVLQQVALPAAIYVGGPAELSYHRVIQPLYGALGARPPALVPRMQVLLVGARAASACAAWGVDPCAVEPTSAQPALSGEDAGLDDALRGLDAAIQAITARADAALAGRLGALLRARASLARGIARQRRHRAGLPPFALVRDTLCPRGKPQERVMSLAQALWCHGPGLAATLVARARGIAPGELRRTLIAEPR